jgi:hypothetical protein
MTIVTFNIYFRAIPQAARKYTGQMLSYRTNTIIPDKQSCQTNIITYWTNAFIPDIRTEQTQSYWTNIHTQKNTIIPDKYCRTKYNRNRQIESYLTNTIVLDKHNHTRHIVMLDRHNHTARTQPYQTNGVLSAIYKRPSYVHKALYRLTNRTNNAVLRRIRRPF